MNVQSLAVRGTHRIEQLHRKCLILSRLLIWCGSAHNLLLVTRNFAVVGATERAMEVIESGVNKGKRKLTALPLLVVLFVISYSLLTRLVIDQDRMIDAQRSMLHSLLRDNVSLSKYHKHAAALPKKSAGQTDIQVEFEASAPAASAQVQSSQAKAENSPSNQVQLGQFPSAQVLGNQVQSKAGSQTSAKTDHKVRKSAKPAAPPAPLTDPSDMRRVTFSI
jgi:hypothetical protein